MVKKLGLSPGHLIRQMSCGQRSQVVLGLLMAQQPELLLLDDYSIGLDAGYRRLFLDEMRDYLTQGNRTVFLTSHVIQDAVYLPMLYDKIFMDEVEKTHLFYSPVSQDFILTEKIVGKVPDPAKGFALDHHSNLAYMKADGTYVPRKTFERHLPFIYYKNMEIQGLLPMTLNGQTFDKITIKAQRRVLELKAKDLAEKSPHVPFYPLLESNPGQARLVFPEDRFRMTDSDMEFINADENAVDPVFTKMYTYTLPLKKRDLNSLPDL